MPTAHLPTYSMGEVFCGAGGLSEGFHKLNFATKFANDLWPIALHTFLMNFDSAYRETAGAKTNEVLGLEGSIEDLSGGDILSRLHRASKRSKALACGDLDVLLGGPPCQGYSVNSHTRSADDPRNHLFRHYVRLLRELSPKVFVLENVPGMISLEGGRFIDALMEEISSSKTRKCPGYEVQYKILNAAHYGVPQERFRVVVFGVRRDVLKKIGGFEFPRPVHFSLAQAHFKGGRSHTFHYAIGRRKAAAQIALPFVGAELLPPVSVLDAIGDLPALVNGGGDDQARRRPDAGRKISPYQKLMRAGARSLANHWCRALQSPNTERVKHIPPGGDWRNIPEALLPPGMQRALKKDHTKRYGRLVPSEPASTLLTKPDPHWGTFIHYDVKQQRLISVREAARLQSFPDTHVFYGGQVDQYKLCGNAVPPLMAQALASEVKRVLDQYYGVAQDQETYRAAARIRA
jgi:DNA (cytosine-5)-methyltransferase 1